MSCGSELRSLKDVVQLDIWKASCFNLCQIFQLLPSSGCLNIQMLLISDFSLVQTWLPKFVLAGSKLILVNLCVLWRQANVSTQKKPCWIPSLLNVCVCLCLFAHVGTVSFTRLYKGEFINYKCDTDVTPWFAFCLFFTFSLYLIVHSTEGDRKQWEREWRCDIWEPCSWL